MAEIFPLKANEHDKVLELLPWFVNGTLSADETGRVETHLAGCAECREDTRHSSGNWRAASLRCRSMSTTAGTPWRSA